jgi:hypothetical protein
VARFNEETLNSWRKPPSDTEDSKLSNSLRLVKDAISKHDWLSTLNLDIFGQGSYANDTNVRLNSDIDVCVMNRDCFFYDIPKNAYAGDYGLGTPCGYLFREYKNQIEKALKDCFGRESVVRGNKCITVKGNTYRIETDVVAAWEYRNYGEQGGYVAGTKLISDASDAVLNYPKQHIFNAIQKNHLTHKRFKRLTRILKKIRYRMIADGFSVDDGITSFLLESLLWNVPDNVFIINNTWSDRLKEAIVFLYNKTTDPATCKEWGEVSELLYLFHNQRKWTIQSVNKFMQDLWTYLEF